MTRDNFIHYINLIFGDHLEEFLADLNNSYNLTRHDLINHEEQCYIINWPSLKVISWYKTYHIGRDLATNLESDDEIIAFLNSLYEDYLDNLPDI